MTGKLKSLLVFLICFLALTTAKGAFAVYSLVKKRQFSLRIFVFIIVASFTIFTPTKAYGATEIYYSVGQNTNDHKTGAPTVTVSGTTATFSVPQTATNMGVGDLVTYTGGTCYISGKTSTSVWSCVSVTGGTPTAATNASVTSIAHAFASLSAAVTGSSDASHLNTTDLVVGDYKLNIPCYYDTGADTTVVDIDGYTTGAANYIKIYTPSNTATEANQNQRHSGKWDATKYNLSVDGYPLTLKDKYVQVLGLQIEEVSAGSREPLAIVTLDATISNNILRTNALGNNSGISATASNAQNKIYNNIVICNGRGFSDSASTGGSGSFVYSNTFISFGTYSAILSKVGQSTPTHFKNNIFKGFSSIGAFDVAADSDYNATDLATYDWTIVDGGTGANNKNSQTFSFIDSAGDDYHLSSFDTAAKDAGVNLSADVNLPFSTDIDNQSRPIGASWDIGADEAEPKKVFYSVGQSTADLKTGTPNVSITNGVATFDTAQTGNIGVGDVMVVGGVSYYISAKTSTTIWSVVTVTGGIPADISSTAVTSIKRVYTALQSAVAGAPTLLGTSDLVAGNYQLNFPCYYDSAADTTAVTVDGYTTGVANYIKIYTPNNTVTEANVSQRHGGKWDEGKYRLEVINSNSLRIFSSQARVDGLQVKLINNSGTSSRNAIFFLPGANQVNLEISNNLLVGDITGGTSDYKGFEGVYETGSSGTMKVWNNVVYSESVTPLNNGLYLRSSGEWYVSNNTVYGTSRGFYINQPSGGMVVTNNISYNNADNYDYDTADIEAVSSNNLSGPTQTDAPGISPINSTTVQFADATNNDFHLASTDTAAKNAGADLSADINLAFTTDIDGNTRNTAINAWDIGADEAATQIYRSVGPSATTALTDDGSHARNVTLTSGTATFSTALADNIGVGDAVLIDTGGTNDAIDASDTLLFIHGRTDSTHYTLRTQSGATPSDIAANDTYQIYRAYTSLANAESGTKNTSILIAFTGGDRDLVTNNEQWNIATYANGTTADTTAVRIEGWVTKAQNFIKIYTPITTSEVGISQRHVGKWDDGKYNITASETGIYLKQGSVRIDGIQINDNSSGTINTNGIYYDGTEAETSDIRISNCILKYTGTTTGAVRAISTSGTSSAGKIWNTVIYGGWGVGYYPFQSASNFKLYNNTISGCTQYGARGNGSGNAFINNILFNNVDDFYAAGNIDYNASDDGDGTNAVLLNENASSEWENNFVDYANKDFHLKNTAPLKNVGLTDPTSGLFTTDIDGAKRNPDGLGWDIGADEVPVAIYRSVGPGATGILESDSSHARNITLSSGTATFSTALSDSIGVGDAVLIDTGGTDQAIDASDTLLFIHGRTDSTHYTLRTQSGAMPNDIAINDTYQIYRAYTSFSLAEAGTKNTSIPIAFTGGNRDLVANNEQWNIACYANGTTVDTTEAVVDGWTTGLQNYLKIYTPVTSNEVGVSQRHSGKWDDEKYSISIISGFGSTISINTSHVRLDGIQIQAGYSNYAVSVSGAYQNISNNIIRGINGSTRHLLNLSGYGIFYVNNNIVYCSNGSGAYGIRVNTFGQVAYFYNNTVYSCFVGINGNGNASIYAKNNIAYNNTIDYTDSFNSASTNNLSEDDTAPAFNAYYRNATVSFVDATNKDFHLAQSDTAARNAGANLTTDASLAFATDIDGQLRNPVGAGWDIGADEGSVDFAPTVMETGGDYSSLASWEAGVETDLVADTTRVFSHGGKTGTIGDGASITGLTSGATATVVHASATQILLENISGTFESGETVQVSAGNSVVISDNGNPANAVAKIDGAWTVAEGNQIVIDGWNTGANNIIRIYTTVAARHNGKWDDGKYRLSRTDIYSNNMQVNEDYVRIDGLQFYRERISSGSSYGNIYLRLNDDNGKRSETFFTNNIMKDKITGPSTAFVGMHTAYFGQNKRAKIYFTNNIMFIDNQDNSTNVKGLNIWDGYSLYAYNNTINGFYRGIYNDAWGVNGADVKNNIIQNCNICFSSISGTFTTASNNISSDATAPGTNSKTNTTVQFADVTDNDFHLAPTDTAAKNSGADLSADANLAFTTDIDGNTRNAAVNAWDIGADEAATQIYRSVGPSATTALTDDGSHARTVTLASGTATFSVALPDNIGVGDAVLIDTGGTNDAIDASDTLLFIHGRTDSTHYTLRTQSGATPSDIAANDTYQIYRAYTSLANAESGTKNTSIPIAFTGGDRDLVANNEQWNIACYANGTTADTTAVTVGGWGTGVRNYLKVYTPVTVNEVGMNQRHSGKWDDGKYNLESSNTVLTSYVPFLRIDGIQVHILGTSTTVRGITLRGNTGVGGVRYVSNCIVRSSNVFNTWPAIESNEDTSGTSYYFNNIVYGNVSGGAYDSNKHLTYMYNNTAYGCSTGYSRSGGTVHLINNIAQNCTTSCYWGGISTSSNNISSDGYASGTNSKINTTVSFADSANFDFHLSSSDTAARNAGVDLSKDAKLAFQDDIDGDQRTGLWSIGADDGPGSTAQTPAPNSMESPNLDINQGLVGHWSFDGDDISGSVAKDSSGQGNNGTINGATPTAGKRGQALSFDGVDDYVSVPSPAGGQLDLTGDFSFSFWMNMNVVSSTNTKIFGKYWANSYTIQRHNIGGSDAKMAFCVDAVCINGGWVSAKNWVLMTSTYDADTQTATLYQNGIAVASGIASTPEGDSGYDLTFGAAGFDGKLDEVRAYNRTLSADEIGHLYRMGEDKLNTTQTDKLTDGLVGMWSFDGQDVSGTTAYDRSGQGNNGTITGATPVVGKKGQGMSFNGTSSKISMSAPTLSQNTSASLWFYAYPTSIQRQLFQMPTDSGLTTYIITQALDGKIYWAAWSGVLNTGIDMPLNSWNHLAISVNGSNANLYLNGNSIASTSVSNFSGRTLSNVYLGALNGGGQFFNGMLDEVRVYNRTLSSEEIGDLYRMGQAKVKK